MSVPVIVGLGAAGWLAVAGFVWTLLRAAAMGDRTMDRIRDREGGE